MNIGPRRSLRTLAVVAVGAAALTACSSQGGAQNTGGTGKSYTIAMVTHESPGDTFWDKIRNGAEAAAKNLNVTLKYSNDPDAGKQATLIQNAVDSKVDGIATTLPSPDAIGPAAQAAATAGIPVVAFNAGLDQYKQYGALMYLKDVADVDGCGSACLSGTGSRSAEAAVACPRRSLPRRRRCSVTCWGRGSSRGSCPGRRRCTAAPGGPGRLTATCSRASPSCCPPASAGPSCPASSATARAGPAGGGCASGTRPASSTGCIRPFWTSSASTAGWTGRGPAWTASASERKGGALTGANPTDRGNAAPSTTGSSRRPACRSTSPSP